MLGILDTPVGVQFFASDPLQAYAKHAHAWLISNTPPAAIGSMALEELNRAFVLFCFLARSKCSEIPSLSCFRVFLA
jgi:hypothetical protein